MCEINEFTEFTEFTFENELIAKNGNRFQIQWPENYLKSWTRLKKQFGVYQCNGTVFVSLPNMIKYAISCDNNDTFFTGEDMLNTASLWLYLV